MTRDDFEEWLFEVDDKIEQISSYSDAFKIDLSNLDIDEIEKLENFILNEFDSFESIKAYQSRFLLDKIAVFLGEALRLRAGGKWDIVLDEPDYAFNGLPIVRTSVGVYCPITLVTTTTHKRTGRYLKNVFGGVDDFLEENRSKSRN